MQKKKLIVANWKMAPAGTKEAQGIFRDIAKAGAGSRTARVVVCPPFVFLPTLAALRSKSVALGAQDVFWEKDGAFTGEISAAMLADLRTQSVIVGHSERRALGDTDEMVNRKLRAVCVAGITPVLCVGESVRDHEGGHVIFVRDQIRAALQGVKRSDALRLVVAYEPIWAIGKNAVRPATTEEGMEMAIVIKKTLTDLFDRATADAVTILYGGSVDEKNAREFLWNAGMDGLLVGRASLSPKSFAAIIASAAPLPKTSAVVKRRKHR
ncbi:MAG: triose-phosphate isomerase [Candidatus Yonathbacteria bacterium RIFCSPHIGHO2_01_FULL_51_10]|uniref:Triosephosphate isomerase n=1 Tax=Candidatus Yonathbacteria bacterium RIFCSPHIGHO2_01_FULL_51_10 TaxID=1802723 RepID=A0A1G2SBX8_9BACT|nr:MAG: triose-phosphate isomerase [Candidatus Yonathbacteria bacterium RIFCSPHIGHO2_01_FULL_51_10]